MTRRTNFLIAIALWTALFFLGCLAKTTHTSFQHVYTPDQGASAVSIKYYLSISDSFESSKSKYPLHMMIHGMGEDAQVYFEDAKKEASKNGIILFVPEINFGMTDDPNYVNDLTMLIRRVSMDSSADPDRLSISGVSAGGILAQNLIQKTPELFSKAVILSSPIADPARLRSIDSKSLPRMLFICGGQDEQLSCGEIRQSVESLDKAGRKFIFLENEE